MVFALNPPPEGSEKSFSAFLQKALSLDPSSSSTSYSAYQPTYTDGDYDSSYNYGDYDPSYTYGDYEPPTYSDSY
jgi:hypothetical protein